VPAAEAAKLASEPTVAVGHARQLVARQIENESMHQRPQFVGDELVERWRRSHDGSIGLAGRDGNESSRAGRPVRRGLNEAGGGRGRATRYRLRLPERVVSVG
jgi:hypothetical protein